MGSTTNKIRDGLVRLVFIVSVTGFVLQSTYLYANDGKLSFYVTLTLRVFFYFNSVKPPLKTTC